MDGMLGTIKGIWFVIGLSVRPSEQARAQINHHCDLHGRQPDPYWFHLHGPGGVRTLGGVTSVSTPYLLSTFRV